MSWRQVVMVRVYLSERDGRLRELLEWLHDREDLRGVTVFRGIAGFGQSGRMHESHWAELAADLPLTVEFFDEPGRVEAVLEHLNDRLEPGHVVTWNARANIGTRDEDA